MIYESPKKTYSGITRIIQIRVLPYGIIEQRHIFFESQDSVEPNRVDEWIYAHTKNLERATKGMTVVSKTLPHDELKQALEDITNGHNNPRERAREALEKVLKYA